MTGCLRADITEETEQREARAVVPVTLVDTVGNSAKNRDGHALQPPNDSPQQSLRLLLCLAYCVHVCATLRL